MGTPRQHRAADLLLRALRRPAARRGDRRDQGGDPAHLRQARPGGASTATWPRSTRRSTGCARSRSRPTPRAVAAGRRARGRRAADLVARTHGDDARRPRRPLPVSALPVDGTFPIGTARFEKRSIAEEIPIWDPSICIDCAKCALVCPHAAIRMKVFPPEALEGAPEGFPVEGLARPAPARDEDDDPGRARRLHRLRDLRRHVPGAREGGGQAPLDQPRAEARPPRGRARAVRLLPLDPRDRPDARRPGDGEGLADARAAVRVLRRLRGLRRDAVPEAPHPAASATGCSSPTRPAARRSTAATCRRRRGARTATAAARPGRTRSSRTTPSSASACGSRSTRRRGRHARSPPSSRPTSPPRLAAADPHTEAGIAEQRAPRRRAARAARGRSIGPRRAGSTRSRARSSARASGSSAATAGPTTSASAASTTCSPRAATSTSSCSTPRSTRTPAARRRRPRRAARSRSSPRAASRPARRTSGMLATAYGNVYVAQIALGADNPQTVKALAEADAWNGPSLVIAYSHCIAHGIDMVQGHAPAEARRRHRLLAALALRPAARRPGRAPVPPRLPAGRSSR